MNSLLIPQGEAILTDRESWSYWFIQLKFNAKINQIWDQVDPDGPEVLNIHLQEPEQPIRLSQALSAPPNPTVQIQSASPQPNQLRISTLTRAAAAQQARLVEPDQTQQSQADSDNEQPGQRTPGTEAGDPPNRSSQAPNANQELHQLEDFDQRMDSYKRQWSVWSTKVEHLQNLQTWVQTTVGKDLLVLAMMSLEAQEKTTLQALIKALKDELAPTSTSDSALVRAQYRAHLEKAKHGIMEPEPWYREWSTLYMKAKAQHHH